MCRNIILSTFRFWTELQCYDDRITEKGFFSSFLDKEHREAERGFGLWSVTGKDE